MTRNEDQASEFRVAVGEYVMGCTCDGLPLLFDEYASHATLLERFAIESGTPCCMTVRRSAESWPFLVVAQGYHPAGGGFGPSLLLVPSTQRLFVGAGERILAYDLAAPRRLWIDGAESGLMGWAQHGDVILMSAELELAAWTTAGEKLWTTFVEPPWSVAVDGDTVRLDVMGTARTFPLHGGPDVPAR
jgi:hypothetical protein